ncbi:helix-turn-helix domain-containing protein [Promicromonospora sp. NPDC023987]|uniref:helix-turn-helix domain-containing protein n=1 Tax=Promicromonospora sp. NPDC023987 TaxID=3155360 RepID=UPI0033FA33F4
MPSTVSSAAASRNVLTTNRDRTSPALTRACQNRAHGESRTVRVAPVSEARHTERSPYPHRTGAELRTRIDPTTQAGGTVGDTVQRWTGHEARLLRTAMRLTQRQFAELLDVSERGIAKWERGGREYEQRSLTQGLLDTALARADDDARTRFVTALGTERPVEGTALEPPGGLQVESHKFLPVFLGAERVARLVDLVGAPATDSWLDLSVAPVWHEDADACSLYLSACGVALVHLVQTPEVSSLGELAHWRHRSHRNDPDWVAGTLAELLGEADLASLRPGYVFSGYWLHQLPWEERHRDTGVRLTAHLSMMLDRTGTEIRPVSPEVEHDMLASGFERQGAISIGLAGIATGCSSWSGVAYHPLDPARSLTVGSFVELEVSLQTMWCYARHIQEATEEGRDPGVTDAYGWRFLRAARTRMTTARANEWVQVRMLREAIVTTSGLDTLLLGAQNALREDTDQPSTYLLVRRDDT